VLVVARGNGKNRSQTPNEDIKVYVIQPLGYFEGIEDRR
jgi:hypothetical protein